MKISIGLLKTNRPPSPKRTAMTCPTAAAALVALKCPMRIESSARSTRPPSMGNAGSMLKTIIARFTPIVFPTRFVVSDVGFNSPLSPINGTVIMSSTVAITTLTAGPARATISSSCGCLGIRSKRATPPMGIRMMSLVCTPKRRAARACPSSCSTTQAKITVTSVRSASTPNGGRPMRAPLIRMYAGISRNVQCRKSGMPAAVPIRNDFFMAVRLRRS